MEDFKKSITTEYIMKNLRCNWKVYDPREECNTIEGLLLTILDSKFQKFKQKTKRCSFWKSFVLPEIIKNDKIEDHVMILFQQWNIILEMAQKEVQVPKVIYESEK